MHRSFLRRARQTLPLCIAVALTAAVFADADPAPVPAVGPTEKAAPAVPAPAELPAADSAAIERPKPEPLSLDKPFERRSAGISLRPPLRWTPIKEADREELLRFVDDVKQPQWTLALTRRSFPDPQHLFQKQVEKDFKREWEPGIVENTLAALREQLPGAKILRGGDPTNIGKLNVGMIILRYTKSGERWLAQHAIIESNDQLYFLLSFTSPGRKDVAEDDNREEKTVDPIEAQAVATFRNIIDSVELLDLGQIKADQDARLFRTRGLFANLTGRNLNERLIPERYMRVLMDGRDVGYSYVVERPDVDIKGGNDGIKIGIRTRLMTKVENGQVQPFPREDSEAWMFTTLDRRIEDWSKITVFDDGQPKSPTNPWKKVSEVGATQFAQRRILAVDPKEPGKQFLQGENGDPRNPWVDVRENYTLKVEFFGVAANLEPVVRPLPPFYLPQAMSAMLPRLIPPNEPKSYLIASYVSEVRQVMLRYIDVGAEAALPQVIAGNSGKLRGVPISDRVGLEGAPTIHWVTSKGEYLGSTTEATKTVILPSDKPTLQRIWKIDDSIRQFEDPRGRAAPPAEGTFQKNGEQPSQALPRQLR